MGRIRLFGIRRWIFALAIAVMLGASACSLVGDAPGRSEVSGRDAVADADGVGQAKPRGQGWHRLTPLPMPSDGAAAPKSVSLASLAVTPSKRPTTGGSMDPALPWLRPGSAGGIIQANLTRSAAAPPAPPTPPKPAVAVHLASYGSRAAARIGWDTLRKMYPRVLAAAEPILTDAKANGPAVRLLAGPFDSDAAGSVCHDILARGGWCRQVPLPR